MESYSQACQDIFVRIILKNKKEGIFLEIGGNHPSINNNTYVLEKNNNWKGLIVEYEKSFEKMYIKNRKRSLYVIRDARNVDYLKIFEIYNFPKNIDYLQIDLEVDNKSTLELLFLLDKTLFNEYKFATVTFEHDIYRGDFFNTREISRNIFESRGYVLVFPDVKVLNNGYEPFEDWYVHPDLVDMEYVNKIKTTESLNCDEIKNILLNN